MKVFVVRSPNENYIDSVWSRFDSAEARRGELDRDSTTDDWSIEEFEVDGAPPDGAEIPEVEERWARATEQFANKHGEHGAIMKLIPNKDVCRGCGATLTIERVGDSFVPMEHPLEPVLEREQSTDESNDPDEGT